MQASPLWLWRIWPLTYMVPCCLGNSNTPRRRSWSQSHMDPWTRPGRKIHSYDLLWYFSCVQTRRSFFSCPTVSDSRLKHQYQPTAFFSRRVSIAYSARNCSGEWCPSTMQQTSWSDRSFHMHTVLFCERFLYFDIFTLKINWQFLLWQFLQC